MASEDVIHALVLEGQCSLPLGGFLSLSCCSRDALRTAERGRKLAFRWYFGERWAGRDWATALRLARGALRMLSVILGEWRDATGSTCSVNVRTSAPEPYIPEEYELHGAAAANGVRLVADTALATSKRDGHQAVLVFCVPYRTAAQDSSELSQASYVGCLYSEGLRAARELQARRVVCQPFGTGRGGVCGRSSAIALLGALEQHAESGGGPVSLYTSDPGLHATFEHVRCEFAAQPASVSAPRPLALSFRPVCQRPQHQCSVL